MVSWDVPFAPGKLEAVGKKDGKEVSRFTVETSGEPASLRLTPDRNSLAGDGWDALPVTVEALDKEGRPVPTANLPVEFAITGPGAIIGHGNGDPNCHEPEKGNHRSLFNGLAQVIVQSKRDGAGEIVLHAQAQGLQSTETMIQVRPVVAIPSVATAQLAFYVQKWRMSPVTPNAPDPNQEIADSDQNSWQQIQSGKLQPFADGSFAVYRIQFKPFAGVQQNGGRIVFSSVTGKAEAWLDKKLVGKKDTFDGAPFTVAIPPGPGERTLSMLIEAPQSGKAAGFGGAIAVELAP
jgi:beta-galactosidase